MPFFLACMAMFGAATGTAAGSPPQLDSSAGYALQEMAGPFGDRDSADGASCADASAVRIVVQADSLDDVPARLQAMLFPDQSDAR
ncbi:MAG TPA: hypothetical protein VII06_17590 [Chloroflexota bacterium]